MPEDPTEFFSPIIFFPLQGVNTDDQEQQQNHESTEEQPSVVLGQEESETEECTQTENTHLEGEKTSEMNVHSPDSTQPAPNCRGNTSQEQRESRGVCVTEEAAVRCVVHVQPSDVTEDR